MAWTTVGKRLASGGSANYALKISKNEKDKLSFTLDPTLMKLLGWQNGCYVVFVMDKIEGLGGIKLSGKQEGLKLANTNKRSQLCTVRFKAKKLVRDRCVNGQARELSMDELIIDEDNGIVAFETI